MIAVRRWWASCLVLGVLVLVGGSGALLAGGGAELPDLTPQKLKLVQGMVMLTVQNLKPAGQYLGKLEVTYQIDAGNPRTTKPEVEFSGNPVFDVFMFRAEEIKGQAKVVVSIKLLDTKVKDANLANNQLTQTLKVSDSDAHPGPLAHDLSIESFYADPETKAISAWIRSDGEDYHGDLRIACRRNEGAWQEWVVPKLNLVPGDVFITPLYQAILPGPNNIEVKLDPQNALREKNEKNNHGAHVFKWVDGGFKILQKISAGHPDTPLRKIVSGYDPLIITPDMVKKKDGKHWIAIDSHVRSLGENRIAGGEVAVKAEFLLPTQQKTISGWSASVPKPTGLSSVKVSGTYPVICMEGARCRLTLYLDIRPGADEWGYPSIYVPVQFKGKF